MLLTGFTFRFKVGLIAERKQELQKDKEDLEKAIEEHNRLEDERVARYNFLLCVGTRHAIYLKTG